MQQDVAPAGALKMSTGAADSTSASRVWVVGHERGVLQVLAVEVGDAVEAAQVERAGQPEDLVLGDVELRDQQVEHASDDRLLDLQPHRRPEPAAQQLLLQGGEQVLGVVLLDLEVLVAGDPEGVRLQHLHAGEEPLEVRRR